MRDSIITRVLGRARLIFIDPNGIAPLSAEVINELYNSA
jgi:hypothetical protein